jgi:hypothetical protein
MYEADWGDPIITYEWTELDGNLIIEKDISHVGVYAMKDVPWVMITGLDMTLGGNMGVLPTAPYWSQFPDVGQFRMEGLIYDYSGKQTANGLLEGPFMGAHVTSNEYDYTEDGVHYSGIATEFHKYENLDNSEHADDYDSYYMACDQGFAWSINNIDYSVWITSRGVPIPLRARLRLFSSDAGGDLVGQSTRIWLTHAFTGLTLTDGDETTHAAGSIATLVSDGKVILYEFAGSSGHEPMIDERMLRLVCGLSNARPQFPGDNTFDSITLSGTPYQVS